ncbi:hypothetical protein Acor_67860 [Acrocarpospora corrugata]|uniref:Uncharacterized protein n=1 Tax=Acrocarpospora corrugata TaxID=35763 RepID=A0A5M3WE84_9ACTN|nr:hypothetical protein [Acrocarpospora corrugata]GES04718.1 hypothetical protein Acor_67860 [Acrocarpospora corrugata]
MPINRRDLHDLLDERSRHAFERPIPWEPLRARVRAARRRRLAVVAGVVAVVASASMLSLRGPEKGDQTITASAGGPIPAQLEEADGTVYRRVATATLDASREKTVTFDVEVRGRPLAILPNCPTKSMFMMPDVTVRVPGVATVFTLSPLPFLSDACETNRPVDVMPLPAGTRRARFTVKAPKGFEDVRLQKWRFGVYEWTPPATMKAASPPAEPPAGFGGYTLITKKSITWPAVRELTVTVPNEGRSMAFLTYCGGDVAGRLAQEVRVNGRLIKSSIVCSASPADRGIVFTTLGGPRPRSQKTVTIQVRLVAKVPDHQHRPGALTVAVYDEPG